MGFRTEPRRLPRAGPLCRLEKKNRSSHKWFVAQVAGVVPALEHLYSAANKLLVSCWSPESKNGISRSADEFSWVVQLQLDQVIVGFTQEEDTDGLLIFSPGSLETHQPHVFMSGGLFWQWMFAPRCVGKQM